MYAVGEVVADRYRITARLGQRGITYEAETIGSGERVALKELVLGEAEGSKAIDLFRRAASALAAIKHPCIPPYLPSFEVERDGVRALHLVQTFAKGESLAKRIAAGARFDERELRRIADAVLGILEYLHGLTPPIAHRDIVPANLVQSADGAIALVDFGTTPGTHEAASDLHALGMTLLALATGSNPPELPKQKLRFAIPKSAGLSAQFIGWLEKLIEASTRDRFESAHAARASLRSGKLPRRTSPLLVAMLLGVFGWLVVGGYWYVRKTQRAAESKVASTPPVPPLPVRLDLATYKDALILNRRLTGHMKTVSALAVTADGKRLVSGSYDHTVRLWDLSSGDSIRSFPGHTDKVGGVAITRDGKTIVSGGDHTVRFWNAEDGAAIRTIEAGAAQITQVALDPSEKFVAAGSFDGTIRTFSMIDGTPGLAIAHSPGKRVLAVAYSPDGKTIAAGGDDRIARLYSVEDGKLLRSFTGHAALLDAVRFSPDGNTLATASDDDQIRLWIVAAGVSYSTLSFVGDVNDVAFSHNGQWLAALGNGPDIHVYSMPRGDLRYKFPHEVRGASSMLFTPDDATLVTGHAGEILSFSVPSNAPFELPKPVAWEKARAAEKDKPLGAPTPYEEALDVIRSWHGRGSVLDEAADLAKRIPTSDRDYVRAQVLLARVERLRGYRVRNEHDPKRLNAAHAILDGVEKKAPDLYELHFERASVFEAADGHDKARAELEIAARIDPARLDTDSLLAEIALHENKPDEALRRATRVIVGATRKGLVISGYSHLETAYSHVNNYRAADATYRVLIELDPESAWAKGNYAHFLVYRGEYDKAIDMANAAIKQMDYGMAHVALADAYVGKGFDLLYDRREVERAQEFFEAAVKQDARNVHAHYGLAALYRVKAIHGHDRAMAQKSKRELDLALAIKPDHWWAKKALAEHEMVVAAASAK